MNTQAQKLRELLASKSIATAVGVYDGFTAKIVEQAGFDAALISGAAVATSLQGLPDNGMITLTEMADAAKRISSTISNVLLLAVPSVPIPTVIPAFK